MKTLVTPEQIIASAFADGEYLPPEAITEADILAAEYRYLRPVAGEALCEALRGGSHPELLADYAAPALAAAVRLLIQPRLDVRCGAMGTLSPGGSQTEAAGDSRITALTKALRTRMRTLMRRLSDHLESGAYPEYDPEQNILKHCTIDGNIIQTY